MIEVDTGIFVNPRKVAVIKAVDDETCVLFTSGQSATDAGFRIEREASDLAEEIAEYLDLGAQDGASGKP